jgi:pimeloyl-ACP methyl ester carboxylesterase
MRVPMRVPVRAIVGMAFTLASACSDDPVATTPNAPAPEEPTQSAAPTVPQEDAPPPPPPAPSPWDLDPPCEKAPCAARPIVFVHGYQGGNSDWATVATALGDTDPRFDETRFAGTKDHAAWPTRSIGRRSWLFVFDYYLERWNDPRGSYTAGPGRVGSGGVIVADTKDYDASVQHEYAEDLASLVDDVMRATGAKQIDIVAHSMGGLVTRSFIAFHGGAPLVNTLLLVSSPHAGVSLIGFAELFGIGPGWMTACEMAELDSGSVLSKASFFLSGEPESTKGAWAEKLLDVETKKPIPATVHVMSGSKDLLVSYDAAHYPTTQSHVVVDTDHSGILKAPETIQRVRDLCGGTYP